MRIIIFLYLWDSFSNIVGIEEESPIIGDVDGDGVICIADAVTLIDRILDK